MIDGEKLEDRAFDKSLSIFDYISKDLDIPILTDVHNEEQCKIVSEVVDVIQIPAFLCRQTDLLVACAKNFNVINIRFSFLIVLLYKFRNQKYYNLRHYTA